LDFLGFSRQLQDEIQEIDNAPISATVPSPKNAVREYTFSVLFLTRPPIASAAMCFLLASRVYLIAISGRVRAEDRHQLIDRRAGLGEPASGGLANAVRRAIEEAGWLGGFAEPRPQVLFADVRAAPEGDEGQLLGPPLGAGGERLAQRREDR
jgi:hypothetical protein